MTSPFKVDCSVCHKKLAFGSIIRHMKTVHDEKIGKRWECRECGKVMQTEGRLIQHENLHYENQTNERQFHCEECPYRTIVKAYLVDHERMMHKKDGNGMFMCIIGKCSEKPISYPNLKRLEKHKTTHANVKCDNCDKIFSAKRNLKRHCKNVHKTQDDSTNSNNDNDDNNSNPRNDPLTEMVERAEILIQ